MFDRFFHNTETPQMKGGQTFNPFKIIKLLVSHPEHLRWLRLSKEFGWILLGQAVAVAGSLASVRILTEMLSPAQYGHLALGITIATLINQIVHGPLMNGAMRFYAPASEQGVLREYLAAVRILLFRASEMVVLCVLLVLACVLLIGGSQWLTAGIMALLFALLTGCDTVLSGIQTAARQRVVVAFHQGAAVWMRALAGAAMIWLLGIADASTALLGYVIASIFVVASRSIFFVRSMGPGVTGMPDSTIADDWSLQIIRYSWPFATWGIFVWGQQASDRWALEIFSSSQEVGLFVVLYQLGFYPLSLVSSLFFQFVAPIFFKRVGDASDLGRIAAARRLNRQLVAATLILTLLIFILAIFSHQFIFEVFAAPQYGTISYLLPWVLLSGGLFSVGQVLAIDHMNTLESVKLMAPRIISAAIGIALNFLGAYLWGIHGIVAASLVFSGFYTAWMAYALRGKAPRN